MILGHQNCPSKVSVTQLLRISVPLPLELHATTLTLPALLRLATICPACLLLVSRHTSAELYIHPRRVRKPEGLGYLHQVKLVDVED